MATPKTTTRATPKTTASKTAASNRVSSTNCSSSAGPVSDKYFSNIYLDHIKLVAFGKFANKNVGPLTPGLNVVYGPNEAGKTTVSEFVKGVLFGWLADRKRTNSYKPENSERFGGLLFKNMDTGEYAEMKRLKNIEGVEDEFHVLNDIDRETYSTMFALNSDELLKLDRHSEVTARLLTAGSGTATSPALVLGKIQAQIKAARSKSAANPNSITLLQDEQAQCKIEVQSLLDEAEHFREEEHELAKLQARSNKLEADLTTLNAEIEDLKTSRTRLESFDGQITQNNKLLQETIETQDGMAAAANLSNSPEANADVATLSKLDSAEEYQIKSALEELEFERMKRDNALEAARRDTNKSAASYETFLNDYDYHSEQIRAKKQRFVRIVVALVVTAAMAAVAFWLFSQGRAANSLTYSAAGLLLGLGAFMFAAIGVVANIRPSKTEEAHQEKRRNYEWVKQQDALHLEACERDLEEHQFRVTRYLEAHHLAAAEGSIRQAYHLLERAHDLRNNEASARQHVKTLEVQRVSLETILKDLSEQRREVCHKHGFDPEASLSQFDQAIKQKETERESTTQLLSEANHKIGRITSELSRARHATAFDEAKQQKEIVEARLQDQYWEFAKLLLAERSLEESIAEWERKSQPEVYQQASRLFSQMTQGAWQTVRMNSDGEIEVLDAVRTACPPHLLSLGTRQQLYLALRVALLITADNVGHAVPILCDDILVNFDDDRRREAVNVLLELSQYRQVIMFTCHPSVVELIRAADCSVNICNL